MLHNTQFILTLLLFIFSSSHAQVVLNRVNTQSSTNLSLQDYTDSNTDTPQVKKEDYIVESRTISFYTFIKKEGPLFNRNSKDLMFLYSYPFNNLSTIIRKNKSTWKSFFTKDYNIKPNEDFSIYPSDIKTAPQGIRDLYNTTPIPTGLEGKLNYTINEDTTYNLNFIGIYTYISGWNTTARGPEPNIITVPLNISVTDQSIIKDTLFIQIFEPQLSGQFSPFEDNSYSTSERNKKSFLHVVFRIATQI